MASARTNPSTSTSTATSVALARQRGQGGRPRVVFTEMLPDRDELWAAPGRGRERQRADRRNRRTAREDRMRRPNRTPPSHVGRGVARRPYLLRQQPEPDVTDSSRRSSPASRAGPDPTVLLHQVLAGGAARAPAATADARRPTSRPASPTGGCARRSSWSGRRCSTSTRSLSALPPRHVRLRVRRGGLGARLRRQVCRYMLNTFGRVHAVRAGLRPIGGEVGVAVAEWHSEHSSDIMLRLLSSATSTFGPDARPVDPARSPAGLHVPARSGCAGGLPALLLRILEGRRRSIACGRFDRGYEEMGGCCGSVWHHSRRVDQPTVPTKLAHFVREWATPAASFREVTIELPRLAARAATPEADGHASRCSTPTSCSASCSPATST